MKREYRKTMGYCGGLNRRTMQPVGKYHKWDYGRKKGSVCEWCGYEFRQAQLYEFRDPVTGEWVTYKEIGKRVD